MEEQEVSGSKLKPLLGTEEAVVDSKGRILINKKKRERLGDGFAICLGENGCLNAYPAARWEELLGQINKYDPISSGRQQYTHLVLGTADDELSCDDQGRVVVPQKIRTMAKLTKDVVIVGCGDRIEIWDKAEHEIYIQSPDTYGAARRASIEKAYQGMKSA